MSEKRDVKIGAGHLEAFGRQGLAEIRNALYADGVAQRYAEPGLYGTAVSSEIDRQRQAEPMAATESMEAPLERDPGKQKKPESEIERD